MTTRTEAPRQPDLALGDTLPPPKQRKCIGCGQAWVGGHSCLTPSRTPTTDTRVHEAGVTKLYEDRPNREGQYVVALHHACGCVKLGCTRDADERDRMKAEAEARPCSSCRFRANRSALDEEALRA